MVYKSKKTGITHHGTGFFWKKNKFDIIKIEKSTELIKIEEAKLNEIEQSKLTEIEKSIESESLKEKAIWYNFNKDDGAQIFGVIGLKVKSTEKKLAVCTLHLESKKETAGEKMRVNEVWDALYWLNHKKYTEDLEKTWNGMGIQLSAEEIPRSLKKLTKEDVMDEYPVIITGDFNAERKLSYDEKGNIVQPGAVGVPYLAGFKSLYDEVNRGDLLWTSWKKRPAGRTDKYTIDYIFGSDRIEGVNVLTGVPDTEVDPNLLPNWNYGSDHISLVVDFEIVEGNPNRQETNSSEGSWNWKVAVPIAIAVVVISVILWKCWGPGNRRSKSRTASSNGSKNS